MNNHPSIDREKSSSSSLTVDINGGSNSSSGSSSKGVSSPIHSLRKKGFVVRQSIEEFFTNVHGALSELSNRDSSNNNSNNNNTHHDSPPVSPRSNSSSLAGSEKQQQFQRSNSNKQLVSNSTSSSNSSSPQSSNRSSVSQMKSLAKFYLLAQQIDYVHVGTNTFLKPAAPQDPLLPVENFSGVLNVQWTTYWTIHLIQSTTCLDILKYISQKTNREVMYLKLADSDGKILDHDYLLIQHRCKKFVVFEEIIIENIQNNNAPTQPPIVTSTASVNTVNYSSSSSTTTTPSSSTPTSPNNSNNKLNNYPTSPLVSSPILVPTSNNNNNCNNSNNSGSGSPTGQRKLPPAPPPRSPSTFPANPLMVHTELISEPAEGRPSGISHTLSNGSFTIGGEFSTKSDLSSKLSPTSSPSTSRKNSNNSNGSPQQQLLQQTTNSSRPSSPKEKDKDKETSTTSHYQYCKFLDKVESANNPPTTEKGKILDNYFSHYYQELFKYMHQRSRRYQRVLDFIRESGLDECGAQAWKFKHFESESNFLRNKRAGMKLKEFKILTQIGKGGFGQVFLAIKQDTGDVVTLKRIKKQSYQWANQRIQVAQEKAVMSEGSGKWITKLLYSFQDSQYLYLAMEYHCGGDFRALLNSLGMLSEEDARYYMAEMIEALNSLHALKFTHRDIKPSNFVIDKFGHIKLIDFGLSKEGIESRNGFNQKTMSDFRKSCMDGTVSFRATLTRTTNNGVVAYRRPTAHSAVGSPEYMAPEIVNDEGYNHSCDYWSLGCVFMEMLCGFNPFCADTPNDVFINIVQWREVLDWPLFTQELSSDAADILKRMLCEPNNRMNSLEEFKSHPFFNRNGMTWETLLEQKPPFVPKVESDIDTSYFEDAVNNDPSTWDVGTEPDTERRDPFSNLNIPFFTYRKSSALNIIDSNLNY